MRARLAGAIAIACAGAIVLVQTAFPGEPRRPLLPDLRPSAPFDVDIEVHKRRHLLVFPSATENIGDGPLIVVASRPDLRHKRMRASQVVRYTDGSTKRYGRMGRLHYERSPDHAHWHYMRAMTYELRTEDGERLAPDVKTGFCLGDRHRIDDGRNIEGTVREPEFEVNCGKSKPRLLRVREGISVGWYDNYVAYLEGQYIDVTAVPDGRYVLIFRSNPSRRLKETDYSNNASSSLIELVTQEGESAPDADVLERCEDKADCELSE